MRRSGRFLGVCALAAGLGLGACAPVSFTGGPSFSIGLGSGPLFGLSSSSCFLLGSQNPDAVFSRATGAAVAFARMQQISAVQSRFSLASGDPRAQMSSWKRLAGGGC